MPPTTRALGPDAQRRRKRERTVRRRIASLKSHVPWSNLYICVLPVLHQRQDHLWSVVWQWLWNEGRHTFAHVARIESPSTVEWFQSSEAFRNAWNVFCFVQSTALDLCHIASLIERTNNGEMVGVADRRGRGDRGEEEDGSHTGDQDGENREPVTPEESAGAAPAVSIPPTQNPATGLTRVPPSRSEQALDTFCRLLPTHAMLAHLCCDIELRWRARQPAPAFFMRWMHLYAGHEGPNHVPPTEMRRRVLRRVPAQSCDAHWSIFTDALRSELSDALSLRLAAVPDWIDTFLPPLGTAGRGTAPITAVASSPVLPHDGKTGEPAPRNESVMSTARDDITMEVTTTPSSAQLYQRLCGLLDRLYVSADTTDAWAESVRGALALNRKDDGGSGVDVVGGALSFPPPTDG